MKIFLLLLLQALERENMMETELMNLFNLKLSSICVAAAAAATTVRKNLMEIENDKQYSINYYKMLFNFVNSISNFSLKFLSS